MVECPKHVYKYFKCRLCQTERMVFFERRMPQTGARKRSSSKRSHVITVAAQAAGMPGDLPLVFCFVTWVICVCWRVPIGTAYVDCGAVCLYRLRQVDTWGLRGTISRCQCSCETHNAAIGEKVAFYKFRILTAGVATTSVTLTDAVAYSLPFLTSTCS